LFNEVANYSVFSAFWSTLTGLLASKPLRSHRERVFEIGTIEVREQSADQWLGQRCAARIEESDYGRKLDPLGACERTVRRDRP
jgi:hypothetical protein